MKLKMLLFLVVLISGFTTILAQNDANNGLVLKGRFYDYSWKKEDGYMHHKGKLTMEFVNLGTEPIILINPQRQFGQWQSKIMFSDDRNFETSASFKFSKNVERKLSNPLQIKNLVEFLDDKEPPLNFVAIIEPNDSLFFDDEFEFKQSFANSHFKPNWEGISPDTNSKLDRTKSVVALRYFTIKYEFSAVQYQVDADLLENLQTRWRKYGYLPVDVNGGFSIVSQPIQKG